MNIAHLLPSTAVFPLKKHNGRYEWALRLARIQAAAGNQVTIYAGEGSSDDSSIVWRSLSQRTDDKRTNNIALLTTALTEPSHDIYHSHFDSLHYEVADLTSKPVIVTQHWYPSQQIADAVALNLTKNVITVPVTDTMKASDDTLGIPTTDRIYHGIDLSLFQPSAQHNDRFIYVGRIHPGKGIAEAIRVAKAANVPLDIVGKVNEAESAFWQELRTDIDGENIRYLGPQSHEQVAHLLSHAKGLIFPSKTIEAFGQITVEAQATGTPVIISDVGASRELVIDRKTGFICHTEEDYITAIKRIDSIDRVACRTNAQKFDLNTMIAAYDELYRSSTKL